MLTPYTSTNFIEKHALFTYRTRHDFPRVFTNDFHRSLAYRARVQNCQFKLCQLIHITAQFQQICWASIFSSQKLFLIANNKI